MRGFFDPISHFRLETPDYAVPAWQLTAAFEYDAGFETEVDVTFTQEGDETVVQFEHRNLERFGEVPDLLTGMDAGWVVPLKQDRL